MGTKKRKLLILDANTLIDFCECDRTIIKLICTQVGQIHLATPVLSEIKGINEDECIELGIKLVEPGLEQLMQAAEKRSTLSFQDNICLILAREYGWTCVTNDIPLRKQCGLEGVPLIWGIQLISILVESGGLPVKQAENVILEIQKNNPKYITATIVKKAFKRLGISGG